MDAIDPIDPIDPIDAIDAMDAIGRMDKGGFGGWALVSGFTCGFKLVRRGCGLKKCGGIFCGFGKK